jgi:hypothetical protein
MIDTPVDQTKFFHSATENIVKYAQIYFGEKYNVFFSESEVCSMFSRKNLLSYQRKTLPVFSKFQLAQADTYNYIVSMININYYK